MSEFHFNGAINASNFQTGDYNTMSNKTSGNIDWEMLKSGFEAIEFRDFTRKETKVLNDSLEAIDKKDSKSLKKLVQSNLWDIGKNIFCNLTAGVLVELMKVLVL